jgi:hypothetical protein
MLPPDRHDPRLNHHAHLMRAATRLRRPVRQPAQATPIRIPAQPLMHRLPRHPIPPRDHRHRHALVQDLQHSPIPLLHDTQLHQHTRLPPCDQPVIAGKRTERLKAGNQNHQMELTRRLKVAITELTGETIAARDSSDKASARIWWLNVLLVLLTAALVALTVVLAVKS